MTKLVLIPSPLQDEHPLETTARDLLVENALLSHTLLLVEEHKVARQRWIKWGLPREAIEKFVLFNEHTQEKILPEILKEIKSGKTAYLMSDCGLPAFCDPGQRLVDACHRSGIKVTSTPFANSISLSVALSGFSHASFVFSGFVPIKSPDRQDWMKKELKRPETLIWMETPYRLVKILDELIELKVKRQIFLACDLGAETELLLRGPVEQIRQKFSDQIKKEFVLLLAPQN